MTRSSVCVIAFMTLVVCYEGISASSNSLGRLSLPGYASIPHLSRQRRQTTDNSNVCSVVLNRALCDTSYAQNYINEISKCGDRAGVIINIVESQCRKNSAGDYCSEHQIYVLSNCSSTSACPAGCFNSLQRAGCCLNVGDDSFTSYLTDCRIPVPSPCPKSKLRLPTLRSDSYCDTEVEFQNTHFAANCDNIGPALRTLRREKTCHDLEEDFKVSCSSRNGQYCLVELDLVSGVEGSSLGVRAMLEAVHQCPSNLNCSLACNSSLNFVQNTVGCCVHAVNTTSMASNPGWSRILNSPQWDRCGLTFPQKCDAVSLKLSSFFLATVLVVWIYLDTQ